MKKIALIFGITGQDGSYLTKFLLKKNYKVHGIIRRSSSFNTGRIEDVYVDPHYSKNFFLHFGDLTDSISVNQIILKVRPDEIYNLAAQSHVAVSFQLPEYTANVDGLGSLRILESIVNNKLQKKTKYYQAGTSEMFGSSKPPQNEMTPFYPRSPYAVSKLFAHWITINYREAYGLFACNGILFNHESPVRGSTFVTQKIVKSLCKISKGFEEKLFLGNLYSKRDWGHADDYCRAMWLMLQQKNPRDFVIATNKQYSVKSFIEIVAKKLDMKIKWSGKGLNEKGYLNGKIIIAIDSKYLRPTEVETLLGDYSKAKKYLKWQPKHDIESLVEEMISYELMN